MSVEINHPASTVDRSRFAFKGLIAPNVGEIRAVPDNAHVLFITWPERPPTIAGIIWDEAGREDYLKAIEGQDDNVGIADVALFYIEGRTDEDSIIRQAMDLPENLDLGSVNSDRPVYSEGDVVDMIRTALRLYSTPF